MAFIVRTKSLNHSPQWYESKGLSEDSAPSLVALLNADVKQLEVDDSEATPGEKLVCYAEAWNEILSGKDGNADAGELQEVLEREGQLGSRPTEQYAKPPVSTISRLMEKAGLTTTDVQSFLRWKAKNENTKKARAAKVKVKAETTMEKHQAKVAKLLGKGGFFSSGGKHF